MKGKALFLISVIILWVVFIPLGIVGTDCVQEFKLAKYGIKTKAHVTLLEPDSHRAVHYSLQVNSKEYQGKGRSGFGNAAFDELSLGSELIAFYLPSKPEISCIGMPQQILLNNVAFLLLFTLLIAIVVMGLWFKYVKVK